MKSITIKNIQELKNAAKFVLDNLNSNNNVIALYGEMGAGKTTLIKEICELLEVEDFVTSPTFSIVNEYWSEKYGKIFHFDFYRMNKLSEIFDIGVEEYFSDNCLIFIEWPEIADSILPENHIKLRIIEKKSGEREISIEN